MTSTEPGLPTSPVDLATPWQQSSAYAAATVRRRRLLIAATAGLASIAIGIGTVAALAPLGRSSDLDPLRVIAAILLVVGVLTVWIVVLWFGLPGYMTRAEDEFDRERGRAAFAFYSGRVAEAPAQPTIGTLLELNRAQMNVYHQLALAQAKKSFRSSQVAMFVGLGLLVAAGILIVTPSVSTDVRLAVAVLGAVSTASSTYIARTFLRSHETALRQLNSFFDQPLVSSYLLTAERIAQTLESPARGDELVRVISQTLLAASRQDQGLSGANRAAEAGTAALPKEA